MIMDPQTLYHSIHFSNMDRALAEMMQRLEPQIDAWVLLAAALVGKYSSQGNVCIDLADLLSAGVFDGEDQESVKLTISLEDWLGRLSASPLVGAPGERAPLILSDHRLYLHRLWTHENEVTQALLQRCKRVQTQSDIDMPLSDFDRIFPDANPQQAQAIRSALTQSLTVISGGPGSGKTYTIAMLIALLNRLDLAYGLRVHLAAPTGKAAMRLHASIQDAMKHLSPGSEKDRTVVNEVQTVHRMLGVVPGQTTPRYNAHNNLVSDMVVVDEASMIDLGMMAHILDALTESTRLILLGDKDQLASVAPGAVLGDICSGVEIPLGSPHETPHEVECCRTLAPHIVVLDRRYRFGPGGGIDLLGDAVNRGRANQALELLENSDLPEISLRPVRNVADLHAAIVERVAGAFLPLVQCNDPATSLRMLDRLKLLTPLRGGPFGVAALNTAVKGVLQRANAIVGDHSIHPEWFSGRPIMITRNDYTLRLFNGDIGITLAERADRHHRFIVYFEDTAGGIRPVASEQLTHIETAFALTVHKSQGSEFDRVILVLPDQPSPILTRELLYTAITRARAAVEIWGSANVFTSTVKTNIKRMSGLRQALWGECGS